MQAFLHCLSSQNYIGVKNLFQKDPEVRVAKSGAIDVNQRFLVLNQILADIF